MDALSSGGPETEADEHGRVEWRGIPRCLRLQEERRSDTARLLEDSY